MAYLVSYAMPTSPHRSPAPNFSLSEFPVCPTITFFLSYPTQINSLLFTILSVFFSVKSSGESLSLFMFNNFINPASLEFSPGIIFPDANPYIWSYLSVIKMHR